MFPWVFTMLCKVAQMKAEGYYTRCSGIANAQAQEVAYLCWLGRQPTLRTKTRQFVDPGTDVYIDFISKVPVTAERDLLKVDVATKENVMPSLVGESEPANEDDDASDGDADGDVEQGKRNYPKRYSGRALFRTASNPDNTVFLGPQEIRSFCLFGNQGVL